MPFVAMPYKEEEAEGKPAISKYLSVEYISPHELLFF